MIVSDERQGDTLLVRMQVERQAMSAFSLPDTVAKYPLKRICVKDEHENTVSGYTYTVYAEYIEVFPVVFPHWTLELYFKSEKEI